MDIFIKSIHYIKLFKMFDYNNLNIIRCKIHLHSCNICKNISHLILICMQLNTFNFYIKQDQGRNLTHS